MRLATKLRIELTGGMLLCLLLVGVRSSFAQSLGEIARRERERREGQPPRSMRIYTNEDLARPRILDPEDRARFEVPRRALTVPPAERAVKVPGAVKWPAEIPVGDVARYYRSLKQLREKQELDEKAVLPGRPALASPTVSKPLAVSTAIPALKKTQSIRVAEPVKRHKLQARDRVRVRSGDSLWRLARRYLDSGAEWRKIAAVNPELADPNRIRVGQWLRLPPRVSSTVAKQVLVERGDSMWKLAQVRLGNGPAWSCIAAANPQIQNTNLICPGQLLTIPARCTAIP